MKVVVYTDGGCHPNPGPGACAAVLGDEHGEVIIESSRRLENVSNNAAEYHGLLLGISLARIVGATSPSFCCDSELVVQQVSGWWAIRDAGLSVLHGHITGRLMMFDEWSIQHVSRSKNQRADWLCNELMNHSSKRQLDEKPGIEFRTGHARPGWARYGMPEYA